MAQIITDLKFSFTLFPLEEALFHSFPSFPKRENNPGFSQGSCARIPIKREKREAGRFRVCLAVGWRESGRRARRVSCQTHKTYAHTHTHIVKIVS